ncbi:MAG: SpoIIE family protein phosphatase [Deltaproteobacteria bacterium]|jgi:sigma-B regulation protein RsbU (phosphoserine phosphatase)|nr:SpoIIE family protein phosphatase [Deltaproteobacteria bacterium]
MLKIKTMQQRLSLFLLLPVAVLLLAMGLMIFLYVRNNLIAQWKNTAVLSLAHAAHDVDMRLAKPKDWMKMYHNTAGEPEADFIREWLIKQLEDVGGVDRVELVKLDKGFKAVSQLDRCILSPKAENCYMWRRGASRPQERAWMGMMDFERAEIADITLPRYDTLVEHETVSLSSDLLNKEGKAVSRLEVVIRFKYLIEGALSAAQSANERAFLVSEKGKVLACSIAEKTEETCYTDAVKAAIKDMQQEPSAGNILLPKDAPDEIVGFYKLKEAPWSLVVVAHKKDILAPLLRFRAIYFLILAGFLLFILLLIRLVAGRAVSFIRKVSDAAANVAQGHFDTLLPVAREDEVGQLIRSFNQMVLQLDERLRLKEALDLAMQVQQNLLPEKPPEIAGLDLAGASIYCDETGGDYYDFLSFSEWQGRVGIAVGDVAGHGISAALFMTTARALLRSRITQPGRLSDVMNDVNRLLCMDTSRTGDFMSLFLAVLDLRRNTIQWVRAGHAPGLVYDWETDSFEELRGEGITLGLDETRPFKEYEYSGWNRSKVLFIGTDGIWETENPQGDAFGMDRLKAVIRRHCHEPSGEIIRAITEDLAAFRQTKQQEDDITLVVAKVKPE